MGHDSGFEGTAADLYLRLRDVGESEVVHRAIAPGATILELGCGAGRMTRPLLALGHPVVAVDHDAQMLSHVPEDAEPVLSDIETLALPTAYDVVLMASNLVNSPRRGVRSKLLQACRRHVTGEGVVIIQRYRPDLAGWEIGDWQRRGPVEVRISRLERHDPYFSASIDYRDGHAKWTQRFTAELLGDQGLTAELAQAGLRLVDFLDSETTWAMAKPLSEAG